MAPSLAASIAQLHEPYERLHVNELRRECYRRKLTVIKSGPLINTTKAGYIKLLREADTASKSNDSTSGSGDLIDPHSTLAAFDSMLDGSFQTNTSSGSMMQSVRALPLLVAGSLPRPHVVSPPHSPPAAALTPPPPPRPPRMDPSSQPRAFEANDKRGLSAVEEGRSMDVTKAKKQKTLTQERHAIPDSQTTFSSQTPTETTSVLSSLLSEQEASVPVKVKSEGSSGATISLVTRWERLFARLEAVNEKLQLLRGSDDPWSTSSGVDDASDVEFYTIMKRQLQKELLDCVSTT